jgi:hypothetical protein
MNNSVYSKRRNHDMKQHSSHFARAAALAALMIALAALLTACSLPDLLSRQGAEPEATEVSAAEASAGEDSTETVEVKSAVPTATTEVSDRPGKISAADFDGSAESLSGLILFTSAASDPFAEGEPGGPEIKAAEHYLWAISPDGQRSGKIDP